MNKYCLIAIIALFTITSHANGAGSLYSITPASANSNKISNVSPTGHLTIRYQVTSNSKQVSDVCPVNLPAGITRHERSISNLPLCCSGRTIARGATCELPLKVEIAKFIAGNSRTIRPITICAADGSGYTSPFACSKTSASDSVAVTTTSTPLPPLIAAGQYTSKSGVLYPLMGVSTDSGTSWTTAPTGIAPTSTSPTPAYSNDGLLSRPTCSGVVCIASGGYLSTNSQWLLAVSTDSGASWSYPSEVSNPTTLSPAFGALISPVVRLKQGTCNTVSGTTTCIVPGIYSDTSAIGRNAVAVNTFDGTTWGTWTFPTNITTPTTTPTYSAGGSLNSTVYNSVLGTYMAVGNYISATGQQPFLTVSSTPTTASSWSSPSSFTNPTSVASTSFNMWSIACTQSGTGYCIAAGSYNFGSPTITPLAGISTTDNSSWSYPSALQSPIALTSGTYSAVACGDTLCAIAGDYVNGVDSGALLGYITDTASATWTFPTNITAFTPYAITVLNDTTIIAVGESTSGKFFLAVGTVSGSTVTWSYPTATNLPNTTYTGYLDSVYCQQGTSTCTAVGGYNSLPALLLSTDGGTSWVFSATMAVPTVSPAFSTGVLIGTGGP